MTFRFSLPFSKRSSPLVGIDISSTDAKLLELRSHGSIYKIANIKSLPLPPGAIVQDEIKNEEAVGDVLKNLRKSMKASSLDAAVAVSGANVIIKKVSVDAGLSESELETAIWLEANKQFPDLIENVSLDYEIQGFTGKDETKLDVLLVACRKETIEKLTRVLSTGGFKPRVIDVDYYAHQRCFATFLQEDTLTDKIVGYLYLGANHSTLLTIQHGQIIYSHNKPFDGVAVIEQAKKKLAIDDWLNCCEKINTLSHNEQDELIQIVYTPVFAHIRFLLQFFQSATQIPQIDNLILSGDCLLIPEVVEKLYKQLNIELSVANPFKILESVHHIDHAKIECVGPAYTLCAGLALRRFI